MAKVDVRTGNGGGESYEAFPADTYYCEVHAADMTESQFKDDKTGAAKWQIKLTWQVYQLTEDQTEAGLEGEKWFFQWLEPWYGIKKDGGPSQFKVFVDSLVDQTLLADFDPADFDTDNLLGKRQKVTVSYFEKDGRGRNKVLSVAPLKPRRAAKPPAAPERGAAPAGVTRKAAPVVRNQPVAVAEPGDDVDADDLF